MHVTSSQMRVDHMLLFSDGTPHHPASALPNPAEPTLWCGKYLAPRPSPAGRGCEKSSPSAASRSAASGSSMPNQLAACACKWQEIGVALDRNTSDHACLY